MTRDRDRDYWQRHASKYDATLGPLGKPLPRMLELVGQAARGRARVLEVAAGTGLVTPVLARSSAAVVATDYAPRMVERLRDKITDLGLGNVECRQADIYDLPFEPASFDAVVAANVLHIVPNLDAALSSLTRVLKPDGIFIAPTFCHDETRLSWLVSRLLALTGFPGHRRFTVASLRAALERAGVAVNRCEALPGLLPIGYVDGPAAG
ncbi:MAG: class I SAM-dependent methyltransferase [Myxococcales bacterium]|nr:class I SAM-dependent methyltransferase [Myxococcales bacterium]MCB9576957.1 class I SAM-dependent methyltransferase [Polyangiaceae bacterium]